MEAKIKMLLLFLFIEFSSSMIKVFKTTRFSVLFAYKGSFRFRIMSFPYSLLGLATDNSGTISPSRRTELNDSPEVRQQAKEENREEGDYYGVGIISGSILVGIISGPMPC